MRVRAATTAARWAVSRSSSANSSSRSVANWARGSSGCPKWSAAASARPMTPPRCYANWAKSADCCASSCWRKGAARWGSMRGFLGNGLTPPWCARGTHHALTRVKKRLHSPCGEPGMARRKPMHLQLLAAAAAGFPPFFPARAQRLGWRASISAVLVLRSAFTRCTWGRSAMRAR